MLTRAEDDSTGVRPASGSGNQARQNRGIYSSVISNVNSHSSMSFHPGGAPHAHTAPTGVDAHMCWIQAFDNCGFLCNTTIFRRVRGTSFGVVVLPALGNITTSCPTEEMTFAVKEGGSTGDYQGKFDHMIVMSWIRLRLIPALQARYLEWFKWHQSQSSKTRRSANIAAPLTKKPAEISVVL